MKWVLMIATCVVAVFFLAKHCSKSKEEDRLAIKFSLQSNQILKIDLVSVFVSRPHGRTVKAILLDGDFSHVKDENLRYIDSRESLLDLIGIHGGDADWADSIWFGNRIGIYDDLDNHIVWCFSDDKKRY